MSAVATRMALAVAMLCAVPASAFAATAGFTNPAQIHVASEGKASAQG